MELVKTIYNPETKIWKGRHMPLVYHPDVSIAQIIFGVLDRNPNRVVQISEDSGIEVTTDDIKIRSVRAALNLLQLNLTNEDCIGIVALNNHHLAPIVVASLLIGVPIHPLDPSMDAADMSHLFNLSKPKIIFCDHNMLDRVKATSKDIGLNPRLVTFDEKIEGAEFIEEFFQPISNENDFIPIHIGKGEQKIALIMCSSGTTGVSKAVCLSHAQITEKFTSIWQQTYDDVYLCFSSIYWITGVLSILCGLTYCTTRIITRKRFTPELFFKIVQKYRVTQFLGPPSQLGLIFQHPDIASAKLSSMKNIFCGGSFVPQEYAGLVKKYFTNAKLFIGYGLSEIGGIITGNFNGKADHVGDIGHNTEIKIVDDYGNNLDVNEDGELVIRTIFGFLGYKGDPELTKKVLSNSGWIYTGDIGHFDKDGHLYMVDRKKDMFKYRGFVISPSEIEQFLLMHDFIESICVVGIPNKISGELPAVVLVKSERFEPPNKDGTVEETVYNLVKENLADYKLLRGGVYVVEELPMTPSGKIMRRKVLEMAIELYKHNEKV